jgi:hypothetical protein
MKYVTEAKYIKDYIVEIAFNDNKKGLIDLEDVIKKDPRAIFRN